MIYTKKISISGGTVTVPAKQEYRVEFIITDLPDNVEQARFLTMLGMTGIMSLSLVSIDDKKFSIDFSKQFTSGAKLCPSILNIKLKDDTELEIPIVLNYKEESNEQ